jgi:hypothetical protein
LLDTVPQLDVRHVSAPDEEDTRGAPPFAPQMLGCRWLSASGVGGFSRRKSAQACARHLACIALVGAARPDLRTSSACRPQPLEAFKAVCVPGVRGAGTGGGVQWGTVATAGTPLQGKASHPKALRDGEMQKEVERLREDLEALVTQAFQQDAATEAAVGSRQGAAWPAELARREARVPKIAAAMRRWEAAATAAAAGGGRGGAPAPGSPPSRPCAQAGGRCPSGHSAAQLHRPRLA